MKSVAGCWGRSLMRRKLWWTDYCRVGGGFLGAHDGRWLDGGAGFLVAEQNRVVGAQRSTEMLIDDWIDH